jgi:DNA recombination protein RmuC
MDVFALLSLFLLLLMVVLLVVLLRRRPADGLAALLDGRMAALRQDLDRVERNLREEHRAGRGEQGAALTAFDTRLAQFTERTETGLGSLRQNLGDDARRAREESATGLRTFGLELQGRLEKLTDANERRLAEIRGTLENKLKDIQTDNAAKLEQMRQTVDEKLQSTLETRLGESFRQVSERLEQVHRGLGEMQSLATGVGDLKRVLGNVKTRGIFGEVQLGAILEQVMTPEQYAANVPTRPGSAERVEFAVRLPGAAGDPGSQVWLPIDAKFPREDYERLLDAQERADADAAAVAGLALERRHRCLHPVPGLQRAGRGLVQRLGQEGMNRSRPLRRGGQ